MSGSDSFEDREEDDEPTVRRSAPSIYRVTPRIPQSMARRNVDVAQAAAEGGGGGSRPEKIARGMLNRAIGPCGNRRQKINLRELRRQAFHSRLRRGKGNPDIISVEFDYRTHERAPPGCFRCVVEIHGPSHVSPQAYCGGIISYHRTIEYDAHKEAWALAQGMNYYAIYLNDPDLRDPYVYRECGDDVLIDRVQTVITLIEADAADARMPTHRQYLDAEKAEREAQRELEREERREAREAEREAKKKAKKGRTGLQEAIDRFIDDSAE
jgi:hypothetical protein